MKIKILLLMLIATVHLFAVSQKSVEFYVKRYMEKKMHSKVEKIETLSSYEIGGTKGWKVYFLALNVKMKMGTVYRNKDIYQVVYNKGKKIAFSLKNKQGNEYSKVLKPHVAKSAYDAEHLLAGDANAKHKILIFSDPFCPLCQEIIPELISTVQSHPQTFALYSYHLPLVRIHPASEFVTKVMYLLQKERDIEGFKAMYHLLISEREKNAQKIFNAIEQKIGKKFTLSDVNTKEITKAFNLDKKLKKRLMVTGTPTIFIDGVWDASRLQYKKLIPKEVVQINQPVEKEEEKGFFSSLF